MYSRWTQKRSPNSDKTQEGLLLLESSTYPGRFVKDFRFQNRTILDFKKLFVSIVKITTTTLQTCTPAKCVVFYYMNLINIMG